MSIKVLLIDDQAESVEAVRQELTGAITGAECTVATFEEAANEIKRFQPDVVVLDLMKGDNGGQENAGSPIAFQVWDHRFCPFIFYTAAPNSAPEFVHPLVTTVSKGSGSELQVLDRIKSFLPHVAALGKVSTEINDALRRALRESGARVFAENTTDNELLVRTIRRRVAASMDDAMAAGEPNLKSWEQYLCPASAPHLLTGDILREQGQGQDNPESYRVVLTPSCDLASSEGRKPKVQSVLLAKCKGVSLILKDLAITVTPREGTSIGAKEKRKLLSLLRQGYGHSSFPISGLPGMFPVMAADFRELELLPLADVFGEETRFDRIASVDNPFRELFVWAYLSSAGRPGMPDRDFEAWANEIDAELSKKIDERVVQE